MNCRNVPRTTTLRILLALAAFALPLQAAAVLWTTPAQPVAGLATRLVVEVSSNRIVTLEASVEGNLITLLKHTDCGDVCIPTPPLPQLAQATVPGLDAGEYTLQLVEVLDDGSVGPAQNLGTIVVEDGPAPRLVRPAEGFWSPVGQPGSGLFLERRGNLLAATSYSYDSEGVPLWSLGTGDYKGDTAPLVMMGYDGGDCLGCETHVAPQPPLPSAAGMRLRFESARRAWVDTVGLSDASLAMVSLPYGAEYIPVTLTDTVDAEFGTLPLPDLRGRWLFAVEGRPDYGLSYTGFDSVVVEGNVARFAIAGFDHSDTLTCRPADETRRAGCTFKVGATLATPPPWYLPLRSGDEMFVALGDIEEDRMLGVFEHEGEVLHVRAFRVGSEFP